MSGGPTRTDVLACSPRSPAGDAAAVASAAGAAGGSGTPVMARETGEEGATGRDWRRGKQEIKLEWDKAASSSSLSLSLPASPEPRRLRRIEERGGWAYIGPQDPQ
jgi:hypothetical protein